MTKVWAKVKYWILCRPEQKYSANQMYSVRLLDPFSIRFPNSKLCIAFLRPLQRDWFGPMIRISPSPPNQERNTQSKLLMYEIISTPQPMTDLPYFHRLSLEARKQPQSSDPTQEVDSAAETRSGKRRL